MSSLPLSCCATAVSELTAGVYLICSPSLANSPSCSAMKNPAESMAGTTPTSSTVFSAGPKFVGRVFSSAMPPIADEEPAAAEEQPAASAATAVSTVAHAAVRPHLRMPVTRHLTELAADHPCPGRINHCKYQHRPFAKNGATRPARPGLAHPDIAP